MWWRNRHSGEIPHMVKLLDVHVKQVNRSNSRRTDGQETEAMIKNIWWLASMGSIPSNVSSIRLMWGANPHPHNT